MGQAEPYCQSCGKMIMQSNVCYGINPDAVCSCSQPAPAVSAPIAASPSAEALRNLCGEMYQIAGSLGAPANVLDNLSCAAQGLPLPHETLLPFRADVLAWIERLAEEWRRRATASMEEAGRIRRTVVVATEAEANCMVRAELWDKCADELAALRDELVKERP